MGGPAFSSRETPLLDALRAQALHSPDPYSHNRGESLQTAVGLLACLFPIAICMYSANLQPIFVIRNVEFTQPDIVVIALVFLVIVHCVLRGFHRLPKQVAYPFLLYFLSSAISALFAFDKLRALAALVQMWEFIAITWCASLVTSAKRALQIVHFMLLVYSIESLIAIGQFISSDPMPRGTFINNQHYSIFMGCGAAVSFALFSLETSPRKRVLYACAMSLVLLGCILGQERAPWVAFLISGTVTVLLMGARKKRFALGFVFTIAMAVIVIASVPVLKERTLARFAEAERQSEKTNTLLSRLALWDTAAKLFEQHPIIGIGPKNFVSVVPSYLTSDEMGGIEANETHNGWLGALAEGGLLGFAAYLYLCYSIIALAMRRIRRTASGSIKSFYFSYVAYQVFWIAMSYHYFTKGEGHVHFLMLGLLIGVQQQFDSDGSRERANA